MERIFGENYVKIVDRENQRFLVAKADGNKTLVECGSALNHKRYLLNKALDMSLVDILQDNGFDKQYMKTYYDALYLDPAETKIFTKPWDKIWAKISTRIHFSTCIFAYVKQDYSVSMYVKNYTVQCGRYMAWAEKYKDITDFTNFLKKIPEKADNRILIYVGGKDEDIIAAMLSVRFKVMTFTEEIRHENAISERWGLHFSDRRTVMDELMA